MDINIASSGTSANLGISVIVPVYNSEATLRQVVERVTNTIGRLSPSSEIILIDDGSRDGSWQLIEQLAGEHRLVKGIRLSRNFGQHNALLCGVRAAAHGIIITLDDDLQHPPEEIPKLLEEIEKGSYVVYGAPHREPQGFVRTLGSRLVKLSLRAVTGLAGTEHASAFRAFRAEVRDAFARYESPFVSLDVLLSWGTTRFSVVRVDHHPRMHGRSGYNLGKLLVQAMNMFTGFSAFPLHLVGWLGLILAVLGSLMLIYVLTMNLMFGSVVPGFTFLAASLAIFSGAQLFGLGIIGEYLARMHFRTMGRPPYIVGQIAGGSEQ